MSVRPNTPPSAARPGSALGRQPLGGAAVLSRERPHSPSQLLRTLCPLCPPKTFQPPLWAADSSAPKAHCPTGVLEPLPHPPSSQMVTNDLQTEGGDACLPDQTTWQRLSPDGPGRQLRGDQLSWAPSPCRETYMGLDSNRSASISANPEMLSEERFATKTRKARRRGADKLAPSVSRICFHLRQPAQGCPLEMETGFHSDESCWLQTPFLRSSQHSA